MLHALANILMIAAIALSLAAIALTVEEALG